jgi:hypothetical protein
MPSLVKGTERAKLAERLENLTGDTHEVELGPWLLPVVALFASPEVVEAAATLRRAAVHARRYLQETTG